MNPKVSICLPSLNTRRYLDVRMQSIISQTLSDWELIIVDDGSTDGSREFLEGWAARDPRIQLYKGPQQGLYPGWNAAIERASAEFIYIATSDDTMAPDCLEKLCAALSAHPDCGMAHCTLKTIDKHGDDAYLEWYANGPFMKSSGDWANRLHIRRAPFDGILHLTGESVYASITQLLIRRRVFNEIGMFRSQWGPMSDFNWNMRATLVNNTIHVPETWAGWRLHSDQATNKVQDVVFYEEVQSMIDHALESSVQLLPDSISGTTTSRWRCYFNDRRTWWLPDGASKLDRFVFLIKRMCKRNPLALDYLRWKFGVSNNFVEDPVKLLTNWYVKSGLGEPISTINSSEE